MKTASAIKALEAADKAVNESLISLMQLKKGLTRKEAQEQVESEVQQRLAENKKDFKCLKRLFLGSMSRS